MFARLHGEESLGECESCYGYDATEAPTWELWTPLRAWLVLKIASAGVDDYCCWYRRLCCLKWGVGEYSLRFLSCEWDIFTQLKRRKCSSLTCDPLQLNWIVTYTRVYDVDSRIEITTLRWTFHCLQYLCRQAFAAVTSVPNLEDTPHFDRARSRKTVAEGGSAAAAADKRRHNACVHACHQQASCYTGTIGPSTVAYTRRSPSDVDFPGRVDDALLSIQTVAVILA